MNDPIIIIPPIPPNNIIINQTAPGQKGDIGPQGIQGVSGTNGINGINGADGTQGTQGIQGPSGTAGVAGVDGTAGIQGIQGLPGSQGLPGANGANGLDGAQGIQGIQGPAGPSGLQGIQGVAGVDAVANVTYTGIDFDTNIVNYVVGQEYVIAVQTVSFTAFDNMSFLIKPNFDYVTKGISRFLLITNVNLLTRVLTVICQENYTDGSPSQWNGDSIAIVNPSFIGATGISGVQGIKGDTGLQGIQGNTGATGNDGAAGLQGIQGLPGADGAAGLPGADGAAGVAGSQGIQGIQGIQGPAGADGGGGTSLTQLTKLGVIGSSGTPKVVDIVITETLDFKRIKLEVLKFIAGLLNQIVSIATFGNGTTSDFVVDPLDQIQFSSTAMSLKTSYTVPLVNGGVLGSGVLFTATIDKTAYKKIEVIGVV